MIKIILSGCNGKMGHIISECANRYDNLEITAGIDINTESKFSYPIFSNIKDCTVNADVVLDFSRPTSLAPLSEYCLEKNIPLVLCTTGYTQEQENTITELSTKIPVFRSANMSVGVNIVNSILRKISSTLYKDFDIEVIEKHHNQKVDAPSGTALMLAETIQSSIEDETNLIYGREGSSKREKNEIGIHAIRGGNIVGDHEIIFAGQGEVIEIKHSAISREVFAVGALRACQFIYNKAKGMYNMDDAIGETINN